MTYRSPSFHPPGVIYHASFPECAPARRLSLQAFTVSGSAGAAIPELRHILLPSLQVTGQLLTSSSSCRRTDLVPFIHLPIEVNRIEISRVLISVGVFSGLHHGPSQRCSPTRPPPDVCCAPLMHPVPVSPLAHLGPLVSINRVLEVATISSEVSIQWVSMKSPWTLITDVPCIQDCCAVCVTVTVGASRDTGVMLLMGVPPDRMKFNTVLEAVAAIAGPTLEHTPSARRGARANIHAVQDCNAH